MQEIKHSPLPNINSFKHSNISYNVGHPINVGRSFTINFTDETNKEITYTVKFKELVDHFHKLSQTTSDKDSIKEIYIKLKVINQDANHALRKQSNWYKFRTCVHRLSNLFRKDHDVILDEILTKKGIDLPKTTTWYDDIIHNISDDYRSLGFFSKNLQAYKANSIAITHQKLSGKHPELKLMNKNYNGNQTEMISFTMQGLSIIASYLKQKHQIENLFVCDSLDAFQEKLKEIANNPNNTRASFVIPLKGMGRQYSLVPDNQHKATIGVEKKDGKLKIIYLDGQPSPVNKDILKKPAKHLKTLRDAGFATPVFWCINQCMLDDVEIYQSIIKREYGAYGCETIALRDAVDFLKCPDFFDKIKYSGTPDISNIAEVNFLPARFMKTTQSRTVLKKYIKAHPEESTESIAKAKSGTTTLKKSLKKNTAIGIDSHGNCKKQNHYVSFRSYKYHAMALEAMNSLTTDQLKEVIGDTFISINHPDMEDEPKTLHDLYTHFWNKS